MKIIFQRGDLLSMENRQHCRDLSDRGDMWKNLKHRPSDYYVNMVFDEATLVAWCLIPISSKDSAFLYIRTGHRKAALAKWLMSTISQNVEWPVKLNTTPDVVPLLRPTGRLTTDNTLKPRKKTTDTPNIPWSSILTTL